MEICEYCETIYVDGKPSICPCRYEKKKDLSEVVPETFSSLTLTKNHSPYDSKFSKNVVQLVVEQTLLDIGLPEYTNVTSKLKTDFDCDVSDSMDNPYYLKKVLSELYGDSAQPIIDSIEEKMQKIVLDKPMLKFLVTLKQ